MRSLSAIALWWKSPHHRWLLRQKAVFRRARLQPCFDGDWYLARYSDVKAAGVDPVDHYLRHGVGEGRDPHPLFHAAWYLSQIAASEQASANPLGHYLTQGAARGLSPHPLFDAEYYRSRNPDVVASGIDLLTHFLIHGDREGRSPHPLFDARFYLRSNPDVTASGMGALRHYLTVGDIEGRNPHPMFDTRYYRRLHSHLIARWTNPLVHYVMQPPAARRHPHPMFDGAFYRLSLAPGRDLSIDPLLDYVQSNRNYDAIALHATGIPDPLPAILRVRNHPGGPLKQSPLVSVLMPAYNSDEKLLIAAVDSVRAQSYPNWELIIVDDGSSRSNTGSMLEAIAARDKRIVATRLAQNGGISQATNEALKLAKGEYIALLDHDDVLTDDAIEEMLRAMEDSGADAAYSDQAYISVGNAFESSFHKPTWSPTLFAGVMYVGHLLVVRRELAVAAAGFDSTFDGAQDFEFMLRISERAKAIVHVPSILYHWRRAPGSIAFDANSKGKIEPIQCKAVNAHFERTNFPATAVPIEQLTHRLSIKPNSRKSYPSIDVLVYGWKRTSNAVDSCVARLKDKSAQLTNVRVIAPRSGDTPNTSRPERNTSREHGNIMTSPLVDSMREALTDATGRYLLFIDPLVEFTDDRWLDYLLLYVECPDVAFVAPHLYRRNGQVGAAGLVLDRAGLLPAMQRFRLGEDGYAGSLACDREVSALHPGVIVADRIVLEEIGGFDPAFGSPYYLFGDAAVRAVRSRYRNIGIATALAIVADDYPIVPAEASLDAILFRDKHSDAMEAGDPYYNHNFTHGRADYT